MDTSLCGRKDHFLIVASASLSSGIPFLFPPSTTKVCDPHIPETTRERGERERERERDSGFTFHLSSPSLRGGGVTHGSS